MNIDGQVAIVAGGASGLGVATARALAEQGAQVAILDFDAEKARAVASDILGYSQQVDVTEEHSVAAGVTSAMALFGEAARIVVSCAAIGMAARIVGREGKVSTDLFRKVVEVNLFGTYYVMTYAAALSKTTPDRQEGLKAFLEKRIPVFK